MIQQPDVDQRQGLLESTGDQLIGLTRLGNAARVIVGEDHRGRIAAQSLLDHFARMDARPVDGAAEQLLERDHAVAIVQVDAAEHLVGKVPQAHSNELTRGARIGQRRSGQHELLVVPSGQLERCLQGYVAGRAQSVSGAHPFPVGREQGAQGAKLHEQPSGDVQCALSAGPRP